MQLVDRKKDIPRSQEKTNALQLLNQRINARMAALGIKDDVALCARAKLRRFYLAGVRRLREPGLLRAADLARALECSIDYLVGEATHPSLPLDEGRLTRSVLAVTRMITAGKLRLKPDEVAVLTLHVYNDPASRSEDDGDLSAAIIDWLSSNR